MANIEIVYISSTECIFHEPDYCIQCHTMAGSDLGCKAYIPEGEEPGVIPFGDCERAKVHYSRRGWTGKSYEIEEPDEDPYSPNLDSVAVTLGKKRYEKCVKVILNGKVIYNNYDDESVD